MVDGDRDSSEIRFKREECSRTKHDREFSKWEILIGACDWEDYSLGKEGAERYRVHNLPKNSGPGVYELGVAVCRTGLGRNIDKIEPDRIIAVYLGQADNVRTRLQHYGRSGSHLGNSASTGVPKEGGLQKGPGLFEDILSRGYPIVFRWAGMQSKSEALRTETRLLNTFDYSWNASTNGPRRPDDVLQKLKKVSSSTPEFSDLARKLITPFGERQVGIRIKSGESTPEIEEESHNFLSRVFKFGRSRPRLLDQVRVSYAVQGNTLSVCGVVLDGQDSNCMRPPVEGKKRCSEHKGMRAKASVSDIIPQPGCDGWSDSFDGMCRFVLADGTPCEHKPVQGNKRCVEHKGRPVCGPNPASGKSKSTVCGVILGDGLLCTEWPVAGRVRCEGHKGRRINRLVS